MGLIDEYRSDEVKTYEDFVLHAFELAMGKRLKKGEDPAGFATTDVYDDNEVGKMKSGASYAMGIYDDYLYRHFNADGGMVCSYEEHEFLQECFNDVMKAEYVENVLNAVNRFLTVSKKYIE